MIRSPGAAASIAVWIAVRPLTMRRSLAADGDGHGVDRLSCRCRRDDQFAALRVGPPYCACCCMAHVGTPVGTVTVIWVSVQYVIVAVTSTDGYARYRIARRTAMSRAGPL